MRPGLVWTLFSACLALVLGAAWWLTDTVIELEEARHVATAKDELDDRALRALWRMEYAVVPLVIQEAARPYFHYYPLYAADGERPRMTGDVFGKEGIEPSPLLDAFVPYTLLHFQIDPAGRVTSPQVPAGSVLQLVQERFGGSRMREVADRRLRRLLELFRRESLQRVIIQAEKAGGEADLANDALSSSLLQNLLEFRTRKDYLEQARTLAQNQVALPAASDELAAALPVVRALPAMPTEGSMRPYWCAGGLFLARHLLVGGEPYVQGCWLDWDAVRDQLQTSLQDVLPAARVEALDPAGEDAGGLLLASLPVRLVPGPLPAGEAAGPTPLRLSLYLALGSVLVAAAVAALLVRQTLRFSERRGAFVSAVTHELRTPLTTLRMYTDLLAEGRIAGEEKRRRSLETMRREAERLGHLVENVLAYSRLERTRAPGDRREALSLAALAERVRSRAEEHARAAGRPLAVEVLADARDVLVRADVAAVEQIVFNLVDNAVKYADGAEDPRILVTALATRRGVRLLIRDFGRGIPPAEARRLFRPFSKSAGEAAGGKPGVGLGLALCRGLARGQGGDLWLDPSRAGGATFVLELPRA